MGIETNYLHSAWEFFIRSNMKRKKGGRKEGKEMAARKKMFEDV